MNLGQSQFQDTYFVSGAQLTPYRRLRQIELEMRSISDGLKRTEFALRKSQVKMKSLDPSDELQKIEIEEFEWDQLCQRQLIEDAKARLANFQMLKEELINSVPQEYWDAGFEAAEEEHWVLHFTKQLTMSKLLGAPDKHALEQVLLLPEAAQERVMIGVHQQTQALIAKNEEILRLSES